MALRTMRKLYATLIVSVFVFSLTALVNVSPVMAQTTGSASLRGTVKDPQGAIIRDAVVTITNERTKDERQTKSSEDGTYTFTALSPGNYTIKTEAQGFKTKTQTGLAIETSDTKGLDISMEVGAPTETVTVTAIAETLQTETGARENTITSKQIDNLSIISRSSLELLRVLPGVVAPDNTTLESIGFGDGANRNSAYHVNGLRGEQNNISIDGSRMIDIGSNNGTVITANPDMVQEVKIQTSNYAAEHGTSAVQISATTKGGSSEFHGSLYDYLRNHKFQANDRSNSINGIDRPKSKYNYPGGNIGGPILLPWTNFNRNRDKLFFFVGYERYYQQVDEGSNLFRVPTLRERQGDFSESAPGSIFVPAGCTANGVTGRNDVNNASDAAPGNNLGPCADPLGRTLLNLYPLPNRSVPFGQNNYVYSVLRPNNRQQFTSRFDYAVSDTTKLYVRFAREYEEQGFPRGLWWDSSSYELPGKLTSKNLGRSVVVNLTNIINPSMTNEILFSASKLKLNYDFADPEKVSYSALGLQRVGFFPSQNPYIPVSVLTWGSGDLHTAYGYPVSAWNDSFAVTDNLVKVQNTHTWKFGAFVEQANKRQQSNSDVNIVVGQWGQTNATGNNYGDLFVGKPIEFAQGTDRPLDNFRYYNYEFYAQDSWKMRPNFTIEAGLRLAYLPQNFERKGLGTLFDPSTYNRSQGIFINGDRLRPNGVLRAATDQIPKGVLKNVPLQLMPRLNFAWDVGGKGDLVLRAGAGLFYNRVQGNYDYYSSGEMPNTYRATVDTPWGAANGNGLSFSDLRNLDPFSTISNVDINSRDLQSNEIPRVANVSFTIEKRLPMDNILSVAYVGTQGRHLPQRRNLNIVPLGALSSGIIPLSSPVTVTNGSVTTTYTQLNLADPIQRAGVDGSVLRQFKPFPAYNSIGLYQFTGTSTYHSLQATLSHNGRNLQYFATYTFGKALGTVATNESDGSAWADPIDTRNRSWGVLPFDRTHVFNLSYNWSLPRLARGGFANPVTRGIFNGWQISGITTVQSGTPIRLKFVGDIATTGQAVAWYGSDAFNIPNSGASLGAVTPQYLGNPQVGGSGLGDRVFDLGKLQIPAFPTTGPSQPPFYLRSPGRSNFDISFFKNFNITESKKIQFRTGLFNVFNQAYPTRIDVNSVNLTGSDIFLALDTVCLRRVNVPNGNGTNTSNPCDPTGGFRFTDGRAGDRSDTVHNFGKIVNKHGRRIVEFALKFTF
ncbi:MAG TPA: carboxypeptidase regulatory-like domain-containing protein [Pyrinomonadaceae bacterium]|nr:carboxypeptidase regulatory-like domain-containing protein [Pyrinomonadaceae bacterium]